jgi:hypothetical protein
LFIINNLNNTQRVLNDRAQLGAIGESGQDVGSARA